MWSKVLDGSTFIEKIYNQVPELEDVRIAEINILNEGDKVSILLDMPRYADNPPKKWDSLGYNTVMVEIDLFDVHEINIKSVKKYYKGNIVIEIYKDNSISVSITGSVQAKIIAQAGLIQEVKGYCNG